MYIHIPLAFTLNYFTIFFICYIVKEYNSISEYLGFFIQYFLLAISLLFYIIKIYGKTRIINTPTFYFLNKINFRVYFTYQILFTFYTLIASFVVPQYIFLTSQSYSLTTKSYIAYLCSTGILCITKLKVLYSHYKEEYEFVPYSIV